MIKLYKQTAKAARDEGDEATESLFKRILSDEEKHHGIFADLMERM